MFLRRYLFSSDTAHYRAVCCTLQRSVCSDYLLLLVHALCAGALQQDGDGVRRGTVAVESGLRSFALRTLSEMRDAVGQFQITYKMLLKAVVFVVSSLFNFAVLISNFAQRPARDPTAHFNLSTIIIAHVELWLMLLFVTLALVRFLRQRTVSAVHAVLAACQVSVMSMFFEAQMLLEFLAASDQLLRGRHWALRLCLFIVLSPLFFAAAVGAVALVLKIGQLQFVANVGPSDWSGAQWVTLLGFLNNIVFAIDINEVSKYALLQQLRLVSDVDEAEYARKIEEFIEAQHKPLDAFLLFVTMSKQHWLWILLKLPVDKGNALGVL